MLFKELRKFLKGGYYITIDREIILEIAHKCGWDDTNDHIYDAFPEPDDYLHEYDIDLKEIEQYPDTYPVWKRIEEVSDDNWNMDISLGKYQVDYIDNIAHGQVTIHLKHNE